MKFVIQIVLWIVIGFLAYLVFNSIYQPVKFNEVKEARYAKVVRNLKDIRDAQMAHQQVTGEYADNFDALVSFIDTAQFTLTQRRDTLVLDRERTRAFGVDQYRTERIVDTIGFASVRDSLFRNSDRYRRMMEIPVAGVDDQIELRAGKIRKSESVLPVFEARVAKEKILHDQPRDLVEQEKQVVSVEEVNGEYIRVGSMEEVTTNGNWPQIYDTRREQQ